MTLIEEIMTIGVVVLGTVITRFSPFILFPSEKSTPPYISYLGEVLPYATTGLLVIYGLKDHSILQYPYKIPQLLGVLVIVLLHKWKSNMFVSIIGGTAFYMFLIQTIFK